MCQARVYKIMQKNKGKWLSTKEIASQVKTGKNNVVGNLGKLHKQGLVFKRETIRTFGSYLWKYRQ